MQARRAVEHQGFVVEKTKSSLLSSSIYCMRQMVLRVGFKFKLTMARVRTPAPSRLLMALLAGYGVQAMALPTGGQVTSGNITIGTPANGSLNVTQTTNKGVIDWQSFNVAAGEKVNFLQPSATSSTLNRVVGSDPTSIFGQITATGQVFLINNAGIYFAPGAQVNAAGLVASTLAISDADYLSGNDVFSGTGGSVDNQGVIKAGFVALAGAQVPNTGTIVANGGTAALVAGSRVTLSLTGSDLVSVSVDAPTAAALVRSGGIVQADGGQVIISAKATNALLGTVVNVDGIVQAHSIGSRNGVVVLDGGSSGVVNVTGTLDASGKAAGQVGGIVKVVGADVGLFGATVDVSGAAGGGVGGVGGDWLGAGAVRAASG
ncbi:MAG: filamentous hemagglutinin N-terminal domain-containing protein, partial [Caulobacter sp.]|nr:filamentous hemagglutinin N-terminal domain-containing protein [Vitreoscilla sp.]